MTSGLESREAHNSTTIGHSLKRNNEYVAIEGTDLLEEEGEEASPPSHSSNSSSNGVWWAFVGLGILNNLSYVLLLACAKDISEGGTALVFLCNVVPGLLTKLSAPYWFPSVSYNIRMRYCTLLTLSSLTLVALSSNINMKLLGVALTSIQCSLGEATLLALAGTYPHAISAFSTGTGWAGVIGFGYKILFSQILHISVSHILITSNILPILYYTIYFQKLYRPFDTHSQQIQLQEMKEEQTQNNQKHVPTAPNTNNTFDGEESNLRDHNESLESHLQSSFPFNKKETDHNQLFQNLDNESLKQGKRVSDMSPKERLFLTLSFWPYGIPLALVYFSEYALQSGTWSSMGIPNVYTEQNRVRFFTYANWSYQIGVCISRSSTLCIPTLNMFWLWILPILQFVNLILFTILAAHTSESSWPIYILLPICFYVGLLGGAVYVHGYSRIRNDMMPNQELTEFALATISVADGLGISIADIIGLFIQSCLYQKYGLSSKAIVSCPVSRI